jgi:hypothetical protein
VILPRPRTGELAALLLIRLLVFLLPGTHRTVWCS